MMPSTNKELAKIFKSMSNIYQYMGGEERFRALAYQKVARVLNNLPEDVSVYIQNDTVEDIPGVGEGIADKIREFIKSGKIKRYEELKKTVPVDLLEMMEITGFGPQSLKRIHEELKIKTKEQLIDALQKGTISKVKGFGKKKVENMLHGLKLHKTIEERILLWQALEIGDKILKEFKSIKEVHQTELAGSIRRGKETIGDIDVLVSAFEKDRKKIVSTFISFPFVKEVLAKGDTKASVIIKDDNRQVDLRIVEEDEWGAAMIYFTGSKEHNIRLRTIAKERGFRISEYGLFDVKTNKLIAGKTEKDIYEFLGFQWMPPEMREDKGELGLAAKRKIPELVCLEDMKGDMQMHSTWSDGEMDIEELAKFVLKNYPYEYIVLTDHSQAVKVAGGMNEKEFSKQIKAIRQVNKKLGKEFLKAGAEVDIKADGTLDLKDELLKELDWVCASIHYGLKNDNTERIIAACQNPYVNCIGHPSGRLIGKRDAYPVNWKKIFQVAKQTHTAFEINCQPDRMDLNDELTKQAKESVVKLVISTDSHQKMNFSFIRLGITIARRAWCQKKDILNTYNWKNIEAFVKLKRKTVK